MPGANRRGTREGGSIAWQSLRLVARVAERLRSLEAAGQPGGHVLSEELFLPAHNAATRAGARAFCHSAGGCNAHTATDAAPRADAAPPPPLACPSAEPIAALGQGVRR